MSAPNPTTEHLALRTIGSEDEAVFFELFSGVRSSELQLGTLDAAARTPLLRAQFEAQRRGYREQYPQADERLILRDGVPIGWLIVDRSGADLRGIDIGLRPDAQGKGVGTAIIQALQREAADADRSMIISVQRFNSRALDLYLRLGFRPAGETDVHITLEWSRS
jgi:GNAT superfamily N-acetyltransferase